MLEMIGASFLLIMLLMTALWIVYFFQRNATVVDLGWTGSFLIASWAYLLLGSGDFLYRFLMTLMVTIWSGRLLWHLWQRYDPRKEDPRYTELKKRLGDEQADFKVFLMFVFQGLIAIILTLPFLLVAVSSPEEWSSWVGWGFIVWALGVGGEALSDYQLDRFKRNPDNSGKVCTEGLWGWSRHPNYFFEFVTWIGFALFASSASFGILAFISPALIYYLLNHVSGIPLTEAQAVKTKGSEYIRYQQTTNPFFPWFPRAGDSK